jgi:hypothetical protein
MNLIAEKVPSAREQMLILGTSPISALHTGHRPSWDVDMVAKGASENPKLFRAFQKAFGNEFRAEERDDDLGIYKCVLGLGGLNLPAIDIDILPSQFGFRTEDLEYHRSLGGFTTLSVPGYARMKVNTIQDRRDFKDVYDLASVYQHPAGRATVAQTLARQTPINTLQQAIGMARGLDYESEGYHRVPPGFRPATHEHMEALAQQMETTMLRKEMIRDARRQERALDRAVGDLCFT